MGYYSHVLIASTDGVTLGCHMSREIAGVLRDRELAGVLLDREITGLLWVRDRA